MTATATVTMELVWGLYFSLPTMTASSPKAGVSKFTCAWSCSIDAVCGGIVWDSTSATPCVFLVDEGTPGATSNSLLRAFRLSNYGGGKMIPMSVEGKTLGQAAEMCHSLGYEFLPHPQTAQESAIVYIRNREFLAVDLKFETSTQLLTNSQGTVFDPNSFEWVNMAMPTNTDIMIALWNIPLKYGEFNANYPRSDTKFSFFCLMK